MKFDVSFGSLMNNVITDLQILFCLIQPGGELRIVDQRTVIIVYGDIFGGGIGAFCILHFFDDCDPWQVFAIQAVHGDGIAHHAEGYHIFIIEDIFGPSRVVGCAAANDQVAVAVFVRVFIFVIRIRAALIRDIFLFALLIATRSSQALMCSGDENSFLLK